MADLGNKTLAELRVEFVDLGNQLSVIAEARREYETEIKGRVSRAALNARIDIMDPQEKEALLVVLKGEDPLTKPVEVEVKR